MNGWFIKVSSETLGPFTPDEMREKAARGEIRHDTPVRTARSRDWTQADKFAFLHLSAPLELTLTTPKSRIGLIGSVGIVVIVLVGLVIASLNGNQMKPPPSSTGREIVTVTPRPNASVSVPEVTIAPIRHLPPSEPDQQELARRKKDALLEEMISRTKRQLAQVKSELVQESRTFEAILIKKSKASPLDRALGIAYAHGSTAGEQRKNREAVIADLYRLAYTNFDNDDMPAARRNFDEIQRHINGINDEEAEFRRRLRELGVDLKDATAAHKLGEKAFKDRIQLERSYQRRLQQD